MAKETSKGKKADSPVVKKATTPSKEKPAGKKTNSEVVEEETPATKPVTKKTDEHMGDVTIERKLVALYGLQQVDTEINKIRIVRGELPLEVQDLEDEIEGLETRIENFKAELKDVEAEIKAKKAAIKEHQSLIKKYEVQQQNVRNNREYDSFTKEIEFQTLEIQLCEKKIKDFTATLEHKTEIAEKTQSLLKDRKEDLKQKKLELDEIVSETEKEEKKLIDKLNDSQKYIEERLLNAYNRIKKNARNGLAVVAVERDACGGCFNKIPPQRQLDIKMHKKIIVCEYCGRILVDATIEEAVKKK
jgi:predicted  nucleic acid-binding Zn-ribbon protein